MAESHAEIITIPRVYLKDKSLWRSGHHTAYCSPGSHPRNPNDPGELMTLVFELGVATNVEKRVYEAFAAAGIATTDRPVPQDREMFR